MADKIEDGGPAFPAQTPMYEVSSVGLMKRVDDGMSLRDYFAAAALQGMCAGGHRIMRATSEDAYRFADAMLSARKKGGE